jgi:homopolymeric O-antigen transport system permease protein
LSDNTRSLSLRRPLPEVAGLEEVSEVVTAAAMPSVPEVSRPHIRITPAATGTTAGLRDLWEYRELIGLLVWRDVKVRYKQTFLGVAWALVQPVTSMILFTVVFGRLAHLPSEGAPYAVFTLAGLLPWQLFSTALVNASNSLVGNAGLLTKVYFPRLIVPIAAVAGALVDFCISLAVLAVMMLVYGVSVRPAILALPLLAALAMVTAFAVGLWTSALNVKYRDVQYLMPFLMQVWLFASPVAYSATLVRGRVWQVLYGMNPLTGVIEGFRWSIIGTPAPGLMVLPSLAVTAALLVGGFVYFRRMEVAFADVI